MGRTVETAPRGVGKRFISSGLQLTLPSGIVRELGPCKLPGEDLKVLREVVLPKLGRGSLVLPAQPRYRFSGSIAAISS